MLNFNNQKDETEKFIKQKHIDILLDIKYMLGLTLDIVKSSIRKLEDFRVENKKEFEYIKSEIKSVFNITTIDH